MLISFMSTLYDFFDSLLQKKMKIWNIFYSVKLSNQTIVKYARKVGIFHHISVFAKLLEFYYVMLGKPVCSVVQLFKWNSWPWEFNTAHWRLRINVKNDDTLITLHATNAWIDTWWTSSLCDRIAGAFWVEQVSRQMCYISSISGTRSSLYLCR